MKVNRYIQDIICKSKPKQILLQLVPEKRRRWKLYREKRKNQFLSRQELIEYQTKKLRDLLKIAYQAQYYRKIIDSMGIPIERFKLEDLKKFPLLTKDIIRREKDNLLAKPLSDLFPNSSGGSTGQPLNLYQDQNYNDHAWVAPMIVMEMAGGYYGARLARLWGAPQDKKLITGLKGRIILYSQNTRYYDSFDMSEEKMEEYHKDITKFEPEVIISYASSIYLFAKFIESRKVKPNYPTVSIISSAETLYPYMRETIERVFAQKVFDSYGSREVNTIAGECERHSGLHIFMDDRIVECLDPKSGKNIFDEFGEIIVTDLNNYGMPFIRYKIGDLGVLTEKQCNCGRNTLMSKKITGRATDNFVLENGRIVHGEYFTHIFYGVEGVEEFQFVQESLKDFNLYIVKGRNFSTTTLDYLKTEIKNFIGDSAKLNVYFVESVPKTPTGKYKFTISKVKIEKLWK